MRMLVRERWLAATGLPHGDCLQCLYFESQRHEGLVASSAPHSLDLAGALGSVLCQLEGFHSVRLISKIIYLALLCTSVCDPFVWSQTPGPIRAVAIDGYPFGVYQIDVPVRQGFEARDLRVHVTDQENRCFYPAIQVRTVEVVDQPIDPQGIGRGALLNRLRTAIRGGPEKRQVAVGVTVSGLYRGEGTLRLEIHGDVELRQAIEPRHDAIGHRQLRDQWWTNYVQAAKESIAGDDHPGLIEKYLTAMLSQRLDLPAIDLDPPPAKEQSKLTQPLDTLAILAAIEPLREEILEDVMRSPGNLADAMVPMPIAPAWQSSTLPPMSDDVVVEAIAMRVPPECFYIRFGSFNNYIWFQELSTRFGGDIAQAVLMRGFNYETSARIERMLGAKLTSIAKMFGDKIIDDMALIGYDLYVKEGASLGVVFSTKNAAVLGSSMQADRKALASKIPGASLQDVMIGDRRVSLLSTPDNRLRSFMVADGNYVLITTSRTLVKRFLEVGVGQPSLATLPSFRWARSWMPDANNYSVFAFLAPEFFHQLVSPHYQIELRRRLEAIAHLEIAEVASRVGSAEGIADDDIDTLRTNGLLPKRFDSRPDGARALRSGDHWIDSLRGARGSFLPIADVEFSEVSTTESNGYKKIADFYQNQWQQMDPMLFGLRRFQWEGNPQIERVAIEGYIAPFQREKYGWIADLLGPATPIEIAMPIDDVASLQLHMKGEDLLGRPTQDYHLIAGVKDMTPPAPAETKGLIKTLTALRAVPAYLGAWPMPAILEKLPLGLGGGPPDAAGYSKLIGGLWRWQGSGFSLLSFDRTIIDNAIGQLAVLNGEDHAQARLRVGNLSNTKLASWVNTQWYQRGWKSSQGSARLLDNIQQQLKVPGEKSREVAERLLDVRLQCALGGEIKFEPAGQGDNVGWWTSTAWEDMVLTANGDAGPPADYVAPWIKWFRGGKVHLTQLPQRVAAVGTIDLEFEPIPNNADAKDSLPKMNFDLFQLPMKIFGGDSAVKPKPPEKKDF
jgi:hypothetical protein